MKKHRLLSLVSAMTLAVSLLTLLPKNALRAHAYEYRDFSYMLNEDGTKAIITGYNGPGGDVYVPARIDDTIPVTSIASGVFENNTTITSVHFPTWIREIGKNAFSGCTSLKKIKLPYECSTVEENAFANCTGLEEIDLNRVEFIRDNAFYNCSNPALGEIDLTNRVREVGIGAFSKCGMKHLKVSNAIKYLPRDFASFCPNLETVILRKRPIEVEKKYNKVDPLAFQSDPALRKVYVPESVEINNSVTAPVFKDHSPDLVIYGYNNTKAQDYAESHGIQFRSVVSLMRMLDGHFEVTAKDGTVTVGNKSAAAITDIDYYTVYTVKFDGSAIPKGKKFSNWYQRMELYLISEGTEKLIDSYEWRFMKNVELISRSGSYLSVNIYDYLIEAFFENENNCIKAKVVYWPEYDDIQPGDRLVGDMNNDGKITADDAIIIARFAAGYGDYPSRYDSGVADMNRDGKASADDAIIAARFAAGYGNYAALYTRYI